MSEDEKESLLRMAAEQAAAVLVFTEIKLGTSTSKFLKNSLEGYFKSLGSTQGRIGNQSPLFDQEDPAGEVAFSKREFLWCVVMDALWQSKLVGKVINPLLSQGKGKQEFRDLLQASGVTLDIILNEPVVVLKVVQEIADSKGGDTGDLEDLSSVIVHFSAKLTHTSAKGGVFISRDRVSDLPYLFSGSIQRFDRVPVDRLASASDTRASSIAKALNKSEGTPYSENALSKMDAWDASRVTGDGATASIDPRLRQIIVPSDDDYVVLVPMYAAGLSFVLEKHSKKIIDEKPITSFGGRKYVFGGGNSQNITVLGSCIKNAWYYRLPDTSIDIRKAKAILHKGIAIKVDKKLVKLYATWLKNNEKFGQDRDTLKARELEASSLHPVFIVPLEDISSAIESISVARAEMGVEFEKKMDVDLSDLPFLTSVIVSGSIDMSFIKELSSRVTAAIRDEFEKNRDKSPFKGLSIDKMIYERIQGQAEEFYGARLGVHRRST